MRAGEIPGFRFVTHRLAPARPACRIPGNFPGRTQYQGVRTVADGLGAVAAVLFLGNGGV